jgi:hypothetical protein
MRIKSTTDPPASPERLAMAGWGHSLRPIGLRPGEKLYFSVFSVPGAKRVVKHAEPLQKFKKYF